MKLIKQEKLQFQDAKSDKVYEADLCEVGTGEYTVNFRYGKRGGNLKEGTKTKSPVSLSEAEKIFDKLVESKTKKGYTSSGAAAPAPAKPAKARKKKSNKKFAPYSVDDIKANLLSQLGMALSDAKNTFPQGEKYDFGKRDVKGYLRGGKTKLGVIKTPDQEDNIKDLDNRYLSRVIWRIGELRIPEAVPLLLKVKKSKEIIDAYTMVWALGRSAEQGDQKVIAYLEKIIADKDQSPSAKMMAKEAKMHLLSNDDKKAYADKIYEAMPTTFQNPVRKRGVENIGKVIDKRLGSKKQAYDEIADLYLISHGIPAVREGLIKWIKNAPLKGGGYFKSLRQLFKVAEFRNDIEIYGLLAYRIAATEKSFAKGLPGQNVPVTTFNPNEQQYWRRYQTNYYNYAQEIKKPTSALGFSSASKRYLQRRTWRHLRNKAETGDLDYVRMAVSMLLHYTDKDRKYIGNFGALSTELTQNWTLNKILFSNSKRIYFDGIRAKYVKADTPKKQENIQKPAKGREEAYPELWDALPQAALHLIAESHCQEVNEFALKIIRAHMKTLEPMIDLPLILELLSKKHADSTKLGLEMADTRYSAQTADLQLLKTLINSPLKEARAKGMEWLAETRKEVFAQENFVADMLFSPYKETSESFDKLLKAHKFSKEDKIAVVNHALGIMTQMPQSLSEEQQNKMKHAAVSIIAHFVDVMPEADPFKLEGLMRHPAQAVYVFGARILLLDSMTLTELPEDIILKFFRGGYYDDAIRQIGINLLNKIDINKIPEAVLRELLGSHRDSIRDAGVEFVNKMNADGLSDDLFLYLLDYDRWRYREQMNALSLTLMAKLSDEQVVERKALVNKLIRSNHDKARELAIDWISKHQKSFFEKNKFVVKTMFLNRNKMHEELVKAFDGYKFPEEQAAEIVEKSINKMLAYRQKSIARDDRRGVINASELLTKYFPSVLKETDVENIEVLLAHKVPEVTMFGAKILLLEDMDTSKLPETIMTNLINGEAAEMRKVGMHLLNKMSDKDLADRKSFVKKLCLSKHPEIREAVKPIITRLVKKNKKFGQEFTQEIALLLLRKEIYDGVDEDISNLLETQLLDYLPSVEIRRVLQLIHSPRKAANILGNRLLQQKSMKPKDLKMRQIVRLTSHEMYPIRKWAMNAYDDDVARIKYELKEAVRIVDAKWDDSRDFAFDYFRKNLKEGDWEPDVLVSVCDSVNPLVQQFGKELITKFFKEENGEQYLIQLSQHPTADLQSFATSYLEQFAADNPDHIEELELYFITVLSRVNKSSVAKARIYEFLRKEGLKNEKTSKIVSRILSRLAAMMSVRDKAKCLQIMRDLDKIYGDLDLAISPREIPTMPTKREKVG